MVMGNGRMYDTTKPYKSRILKAIESTWESPYSHITRWPNQPYPIIRPRHDCALEVDHTDGIGTKGMLHYQYGTWKYAAQDALAMNLNDLLAVRATPYKLQNHISLEHDNHDAIVAIVEALAGFCKEYKIAMTGGETSIMNNMRGMDLSVTVTGFVRSLKGSLLQTGDLLVGLPSSGVHSNGFTAIRNFFDGAGLVQFNEPTAIYWGQVFPHLDSINACIHVAGGGFTRLRDFMQHNQAVRVNRYKTRHPIFDEIYKVGTDGVYEKYMPTRVLTDEAMYKTFNCGIGMILSVPPSEVVKVLTPLGGEIIGEVVPGDGSRITIDSIFSDKVVEFNG